MRLTARGRVRRYWPGALLGLWLVAGGVPAADIHEGERLFEEHCAHCHGPDGRGELPGVPDFQRGDALIRPDGTLFAAISQGQGGMPAFEGLLSEREILDVIALLRTFIGHY